MAGKGAHKNRLLGGHFDLSHVNKDRSRKDPLFIKSAKDNVAENFSYDVDFESLTFGRIRIDKIKNGVPRNSSQHFFEKLEEVEDVVITVKDPDHPQIDEHSFIVLELPSGDIKFHARFFWKILPGEIKEEYARAYPNDQFKALSQLLMRLADKGVEAEEY